MHIPKDFDFNDFKKFGRPFWIYPDYYKNELLSFAVLFETVTAK